VKMKTLTVKMETVTLIGKGRYNLTCLYIKLVKCFFLADILFLGGSSCIQVNRVLCELDSFSVCSVHNAVYYISYCRPYCLN
jgi:hypothetical protein